MSRGTTYFLHMSAFNDCFIPGFPWKPAPMREYAVLRPRFTVSSVFGIYFSVFEHPSVWSDPQAGLLFQKELWRDYRESYLLPQQTLLGEWYNIQLFHACLGNSQNCCPKVPWTARSTIARGRKAEGNGASSCPRYRGAVVLSIPPKQPWNNCFITQPMLKTPVFSPRNAILISTRRQYTQLISWHSTSFSLCLTSSTRQ